MIIISILIITHTKKLREKNLINKGKIIYSDLNKPEKSLFSKKYRLIGKPDYIINKNGYYIPIEVKSGKHFDVKKSHIYQLIAYCQLIEENYNLFTPYGIIVYPDTSKQFEIKFDPKRRFQLDSIIKEMRKSISNNTIKRNHNENNRCIKCSMREHCDQKLI